MSPLSEELLKPWKPRQPPEPPVLRHCNIIDVAGGIVLPDRIVRIEPFRISKILHESDFNASSVGSDATNISLSGRYLYPGFIDCHVYLTANAGQESMKDLFNASTNAIAHRAAWNAKQMLLRGFTTARDTGGAGYALRDAIDEGLVVGPRLSIAGRALSQAGGHGDLGAGHQGEAFKCCGGGEPGFARVCDGVPQCLEAARDELRKGAAFLKIMVGGGVGVASPNDQLEMLQFLPEEIRAITTVARQMGKMVTAHAYTVNAIRHAIDNGVTGIEHADLIDKDTAQLCAQEGVFITPTLVTYKAMSTPPFEEFLPPDGRLENKRVLEKGLESLRLLKESGVTMCFGTDLLAGMHSQQNGEFSIRG
jgi:imidazolonepropionase-like amidohydrolase